MSLISVIVPAYNASATVEQALISVLDQSIGPVDVIILDDGSTDDTAVVLESYVRNGQCVVKTIEHVGPGGARNAGLALANSEYITFLDADDVLLPQACENLLRVAERNTADIVYGPHLRYNWQGIREPVLYLSWALRTAEDQNVRDRADLATRFPVVAGKVFRSSLIRDSGLLFPELSVAVDHVFSMRAWAAAARVHVCSTPVYLRRPFTDALGISDRSATIPVIRDHMRAIEIVDHLCAERGCPDVRASNYRLGIHRALWRTATVTDPAERAHAIQTVLEYADRMLAEDRTYIEVLGIERKELAGMDPLELTPARARYWQVRADLTAVVRDAKPSRTE